VTLRPPGGHSTTLGNRHHAGDDAARLEPRSFCVTAYVVDDVCGDTEPSERRVLRA
jgi:hypothetical protein